MTAPERPARVLVVDDEPQVLMIMQFALETAGFDVTTAKDGAKAWQAFSAVAFDLVVLDLMVPSISGLTLAERIRACSRVPIMMITALSEESDVIRGLETGADDYLTKPFSPKEFALRAQALVRRWKGEPERRITNGDLTIDVVEHRIELAGSVIELANTEMRFLEVLARRIGECVSYRELLNTVWAVDDPIGGKDMIKMSAYRARQALGENGRQYIESVRGIGYMMPRTTPAR